MNAPLAAEQNLADWDACDEHCRSFPRGDACPKCLYDETISLRAECVAKALEFERLRADLAIQTVNATAVLQAQHERDCAVEQLVDLAIATRLLHVWSAWSGTPGNVENPAREDPLYPRHPDNVKSGYGNEWPMRHEIARLLKRHPYLPVTRTPPHD